jgi:acetolactate synthase-1/2/3 large subunit
MYKPNTCIISNGFASMGIALPGAIAASWIPGTAGHVIMGDGGFLMVEINCPVSRLSFVSLIFHDNSYGVIKSKQLNFFWSAFVVLYPTCQICKALPPSCKMQMI